MFELVILGMIFLILYSLTGNLEIQKIIPFIYLYVNVYLNDKSVRILSE